MNEMMKPPMAKKKKSKMRQMMSGRDGNSAMMDTAEQTKMNEMMKKRKPRPAPMEMADEQGMMSGGKVKGYKSGGRACGTKKMKSGGKVRGAGMAKKGVRPCKMR